MSGLLEQRIATIPAGATPEEIEAILGPAPAVVPLSPEEHQEQNDFFIHATNHQRIQLDVTLHSTHRHTFYSAPALLAEQINTGDVLLKSVAEAAHFFLEAAESLLPSYRISLNDSATEARSTNKNGIIFYPLHANYAEPPHEWDKWTFLHSHEPENTLHATAQPKIPALRQLYTRLSYALEQLAQEADVFLKIRTFAPPV